MKDHVMITESVAAAAVVAVVVAAVASVVGVITKTVCYNKQLQTAVCYNKTFLL